ncbi:MAG: hypothetical protein IVW36_05080 [Dehalococcoidia bacterium]|nr:hypothetical protein [Dehalococcoidia bacterium]
MEREPTTGRDNPTNGGSYGGDGATVRADEARERAVLAGAQEQMRSDAAPASTPRHESAGESGQHSFHARAEQGKEKAASSIERASEQIRSQAQRGPASAAGEKVAGTLDKTAEYLHEHETGEMLDDFRGYVKRHPLQAVAGAAIGGFLLARFLP